MNSLRDIAAFESPAQENRDQMYSILIEITWRLKGLSPYLPPSKVGLVKQKLRELALSLSEKIEAIGTLSYEPTSTTEEADRNWEEIDRVSTWDKHGDMGAAGL